MKQLKRLTGLLLAVALMSSLLACQSNQQVPDTPKQTVMEGKAETTDPEEIELTLWAIATESDVFHESYVKAIEEFESNHPSVKINFETFENESYKTKLKAAMAANAIPDIFFTWGGGFSASFVEAGRVLPLDEYYYAYQNRISKAALANVTYHDTLYGSVIVIPVSVMFYNKKMLSERGLEAPQTWEEFIDICQIFIDEGIKPIGISVKDTWVLAMLHDGLTLKCAGPEKVQAAVTGTGEASYNDPDFLTSATQIKELVDMGAFVDGATGITNDDVKVDFCAGKCPFFFTGSWFVGDILTHADKPEDFDVAPIPVLNEENAKITDFMGGASDTLMVAASTEYPEMAATAAFELSQAISHYAYLDGAGLPAWVVDYEAEDIAPITQKVTQYVADATSFTLWFDTLMTSDNAGEYLSLLQQLYIGEMTPEEFVETMARVLEN